MAEAIKMPFGEQTRTSQRNHTLDGDLPTKTGAFEGRRMPAHCNVPTHERIPRCSPAAAGECACPAHAADKCIRRREG